MPIVRTDRTRLKPHLADYADPTDDDRAELAARNTDWDDDGPPVDDLWVRVGGGWRRVRIDTRDDGSGPEPFEFLSV